MATTKNKTAFIRGKASYAKILGTPVDNYNKDGKEWKFDLEIDKAGVKQYKDLGLSDRVKSKDNYLDGATYVSFKQPEYRKDGVTKNDPIKVFDAAGYAWDDNKLIGNESVLQIKFVVVDFGPGKNKGAYVRSVQVLKHVPYDEEQVQPLDEDDEFYEEALAAQKAREEQPENDVREALEGSSTDEDELDDELPM